MTGTVVVKVGTSLLRGAHGLSTPAFIGCLAETLSAERSRGTGVALVTSGAVGLGCTALQRTERPRLVQELQAAAAIGQGRLMGLYDQAFRDHGVTVAQVLLTRGDLASRRRFMNASRTLDQLLAWGVLPVINENDTLATEELRFGDNDTLSALVAVALRARCLVLLTDIDRLYSGDPRHDEGAVPIPEVRSLAELDGLSAAAGGGGSWGTGGMTTKLAAARIATASGIEVRLADGRDPAVLRELLEGHPHGTRFLPSARPIPDRKRWLAHAPVPEGSLIVDAGARGALLHQGASLLAVGIRAIDGRFSRHAPVRIVDEQGLELARGLSAFSSDELLQALGLTSAEIRTRLDPDLPEAVVHRDELVLTVPGAGRTIPPSP